MKITKYKNCQNIASCDNIIIAEVILLKIAEIIAKLPWYKKIAVLRVANDWEQEEIANRVGVDRRIYWNWENGIHIPVKGNRKRLANVLGVPEGEIFGEIYRKSS